MRREIYSLTFLLLLSVPTVAFADSFFTLNGTLADGTGTFNGTLDFNALGSSKVTGTITDGSFSFTIPNNYLGEQLGYPTYTSVDAFPVAAPIFDLDLFIPNTVLTGNAGGALCSLQTFCAGAAPSSFSAQTFPQQSFLKLTATPLSPTPEPGTLTLLGTGLLGLLGVKRRLRQDE